MSSNSLVIQDKFQHIDLEALCHTFHDSAYKDHLRSILKDLEPQYMDTKYVLFRSRLLSGLPLKSFLVRDLGEPPVNIVRSVVDTLFRAPEIAAVAIQEHAQQFGRPAKHRRA
jgi:hypothetical protein